jgi:hypothetical protein
MPFFPALLFLAFLFPPLKILLSSWPFCQEFCFSLGRSASLVMLTPCHVFYPSVPPLEAD